MIKDFSTYIQEGRMGRLVNADSNSIRKQDEHEKMIADIYDILSKANDGIDNEETTNKRFKEWVETNNLLPNDNELRQLSDNNGVLQYGGAEMVIPPIESKTISEPINSLGMEYIRVRYTDTFKTKYDKLNRTWIVEAYMNVDRMYVNVHVFNSSKSKAWIKRLEDIFKKTFVDDGYRVWIRIEKGELQ